MRLVRLLHVLQLQPRHRLGNPQLRREGARLLVRHTATALAIVALGIKVDRVDAHPLLVLAVVLALGAARTGHVGADGSPSGAQSRPNLVPDPSAPSSSGMRPSGRLEAPKLRRLPVPALRRETRQLEGRTGMRTQIESSVA
ncbi:hypothetical protein L1887_50899 [Cichorium endivia]|nr:hypothetical protein L1887_50899 [Cichorium endivia]